MPGPAVRPHISYPDEGTIGALMGLTVRPGNTADMGYSAVTSHESLSWPVLAVGA